MNGQLLDLKEACITNGLMADDKHCIYAMVEVAAAKSGPPLHHFFALIISKCEPQYLCDTVEPGYRVRMRKDLDSKGLKVGDEGTARSKKGQKQC